ncbi:unnamed protein product, partial [Meganyctiphanes norvegica]
ILDGMLPLTQLQKLVGDTGATFANSFVASPLCCPSRSSILSGQYVHNHGAINNSVSGGCSSPGWQAGPEKESFITHFQKSGYSTFFAGKYLNSYGKPEAGGVQHIPPGWDSWLGLVGNSRYYNYSLSVNGTKEKHGDDYSQDYFTNVIRKRAYEFFNTAPRNKPFFMMLSTPASHEPNNFEPKYAPKFSNMTAPRTPNFNIPNGADKPWLLRQGVQHLSQDVIDIVDDVFRARLRTLLTVDDMIKDIFDILKEENIIDNTYVIFTSDNGYHMGQFSMPVDKRLPYETDIRVPLLISGPGISAGSIIKYATTNIDLAPTFLDLADLQIPNSMDGISLKPLLLGEEKEIRAEENVPLYEVLNKNLPFEQEKKEDKVDYNKKNVEEYRKSIWNDRAFLVEHFGLGAGKGENPGCENVPAGLVGCKPSLDCKCKDSFNSTYACIRQISISTDNVFCNWYVGEEFQEYYDLQKDPFQLNNTVKTLSTEAHHGLLHHLETLQNCAGDSCKLPEYDVNYI